MKYLRKIHSHRAAPGLEWTIMKRLPAALFASIAVPFGVAMANRWFPPEGDPVTVAKQVTLVNYVALATGLTAVTAVLTVAIGCVVVYIMKGPAYVADAYSMEEPDDNPRRPR